jgi:hypothetical protein
MRCTNAGGRQHAVITAALDGSRVCMQLLAAGRDVVAAARSADKAEVFAELESDSAPGKLFINTGVDVTDASTLGDELLEGVTQIVSAVGPVSATDGNSSTRKPGRLCWGHCAFTLEQPLDPDDVRCQGHLQQAFHTRHDYSIRLRL